MHDASNNFTKIEHLSANKLGSIIQWVEDDKKSTQPVHETHTHILYTKATHRHTITRNTTPINNLYTNIGTSKQLLRNGTKMTNLNKISLVQGARD